MTLDKQQVAHIAELAHLAPDEAELEGYVQDFTRILELVQALEATSWKEALRHPAGSKLKLRVDEIREGCGSGLSANAPESAGGYYLVPRFIE